MLVPFTLFSTTLGVFAVSLHIMKPTSPARVLICHLQPELQDIFFAPCNRGSGPENINIWNSKVLAPIILFVGTGLLQICMCVFHFLPLLLLVIDESVADGCFAVYFYQAELTEAEKEDAEFHSLDATGKE
jgi:hypothetical protein